jgi:hypothetical protein
MLPLKESGATTILIFSRNPFTFPSLKMHPFQPPRETAPRYATVIVTSPSRFVNSRRTFAPDAPDDVLALSARRSRHFCRPQSQIPLLFAAVPRFGGNGFFENFDFSPERRETVL